MFGMSRMFMAVTRAIDGIIDTGIYYTYDEYIKSLYPTAYWRFEETGSATTAIDTIGDHDGTYTSLPNLDSDSLVLDDLNNTSIEFNGASKYMTSSALSFDNTQFAVTCLLEVYGLGSHRTIFHHGDNGAGGQQGYTLTVLTTGALIVSYHNGSFTNLSTATGLIQTDTVYHVAFSRNTTDNLLYIYLDGVEVASGNPSSISLTSSVLTVGATLSSGAHSLYHSGRVDELAIYDKDLTPAQVTNLFNLSRTVTKVEKPLFLDYSESLNPYAYYRLGETSGAKAYDISGNNHNGTYYNTPTLGETSLITGDTDTSITLVGANSEYIDNTSLVSYAPSAITIMLTIEFDSISTATTDFRTIVSSRGGAGTAGIFIYQTSATDSATGNASIRPHFNTSGGLRTFDSEFIPETGRVYHLAFCCDATETIMYVDGILDNNSTTGGTLVGTTDSLLVGYCRQEEFLSANIDDVQVFGKKLTADEIKDSYLLSKGIPLAPVSYEDNVRKLIPIAYWKLDEVTTATTAIDELGHFDGTYVLSPNLDSTSLIADKSGTSATFNGTTQYAHSSFSSSDTLGSVSFLFSTSSLSAIQHAIHFVDISTTDVYLGFCRIDTSGNIGIYTDNSGTDNDIHCTNITIAINTTYHIVVTSDGSTYKIYVNGVDQPLTVVGGVNNGDWFGDRIGLDTCTIGCFNNSSGQSSYFNGAIDEVAVYNKELTQAQITSLYNTSKATTLDLAIDSSLVDEDLYNFPVLINLDATSGIGSYDSTGIFESLDDGISANEIKKLKVISSVTKPDYAYEVELLNPVAYWRLNESTGTDAYDKTGNFDGAYVTSPTLGVTGLLVNDSDTAVTFNGTNQRMNVLSSGSLTTGDDKTYTFIINTSDTALNKLAFANMDDTTWLGGAIYLNTGAGGNISYRHNATIQVVSTKSISDGKPHFVCAVTRGLLLEIWIDGVLDNSLVIASVVNCTSVANTWVMSHSSGQFVAGTMDEVAVFDTALTTAQIERLYSKTKDQLDDYFQPQECKVEIDRWDSTNLEAQLWVKVPHIPKDSDPILKLVADASNDDNSDNIGYTGDIPSKLVWDGYDAVYHLSADGSDSGSNGYDGTVSGTVVADFGIGKGLTFNGGTDNINLGNVLNIGTNDFVFSAKFTLDDLLSTQTIYAKSNNGVLNGRFWIGTNTNKLEINLELSSTVRTISSVTTLVAATDYQIDIVFNRDGKLDLYINNSLDSSTDWSAYSGDLTTTCLALLGAYNDNPCSSIRTDSTLGGELKEVRLSQSIKSLPYIETNYESVNDTLITFSKT